MPGEEGLSAYKVLRRVVESLAEPLDIDRLVEQGVLRERGRWYEVLDAPRLPERARARIRAVRAQPRQVP